MKTSLMVLVLLVALSGFCEMQRYHFRTDEDMYNSIMRITGPTAIYDCHSDKNWAIRITVFRMDGDKRKVIAVLLVNTEKKWLHYSWQESPEKECFGNLFEKHNPKMYKDIVDMAMSIKAKDDEVLRKAIKK